MNTVFVGLKVLENELLSLSQNSSSDNIDSTSIMSDVYVSNESESELLLVTVRDVKKAAEVALEVLNDMLLFDKIKGGLWHPEIQEAQESEVSLSIGPDASRDVLSAY
eukprot:gene7859-biopygen3777